MIKDVVTQFRITGMACVTTYELCHAKMSLKPNAHSSQELHCPLTRQRNLSRIYNVQGCFCQTVQVHVRAWNDLTLQGDCNFAILVKSD